MFGIPHRESRGAFGLAVGKQTRRRRAWPLRNSGPVARLVSPLALRSYRCLAARETPGDDEGRGACTTLRKEFSQMAGWSWATMPKGTAAPGPPVSGEAFAGKKNPRHRTHRNCSLGKRAAGYRLPPGWGSVCGGRGVRGRKGQSPLHALHPRAWAVWSARVASTLVSGRHRPVPESA